MHQVLVIGAGKFGAALAAQVVDRGGEIIIIEVNREKAEEIKDKVRQVIIADATDKNVLKKFAKDVDLAVVSLGKRVDSSVLVTHFLKELGVKRIVAKAVSDDHGRILKIVGANEVVFPEKDAAERLAASLISPDLMEFIRVSEEFDIVEIAVPDEFAKKTIRELDLRNQYGFEILAIKNALTGKVQVLPSAEYKFSPDDVLIILGDVSSIKKFQGR